LDELVSTECDCWLNYSEAYIDEMIQEELGKEGT
jgi:hypothetical protein